jgi:hypothetical protein
MPHQKYGDNAGDQQEDWRARPDPSFLTTQQLAREISGLRELLEARLNAIDKATSLFEGNLTRVPTEVDKAVATLQALHEAKFSEVSTTIRGLNVLIDEKFLLRDKGVKETADLTSTALQAALAAAEKSAQKTSDSFIVSASKTEATFTKIQDAQAAAVSALSSALNDKMQDQKERITAIEARSGGMGSLWGWIVGGVGLLISFLMAALTVFAFLHSSGTPAPVYQVPPPPAPVYQIQPTAPVPTAPK